MAFALLHGAQVISDLLTIREKLVLTNLLQPHCKLIKSTVAQVLEARSTEGASPGWTCLGCGVVCLIRDQSIHSHFLRLYCVKTAKLLWEQELYVPFQYTAPCAFFHTFPADGYQVGLNFANEIEAEEFHLEVQAVQTKQEKAPETVERLRDQQDAGIESLEQHRPTDAPSPTVSPTSSSFDDLDPVMRGLLMQARLTEDDLKDKDIAEAVDCIINSFGGLQAVQRELRRRDSESAAGASVGPAPPKGPQVPIKSSTAQQTLDPEPPALGPPTAAPPPAVVERSREAAGAKHVDPSEHAERHSLILSALKDVFKQKQLQQDEPGGDAGRMEPEQ